MHKSQQKLLELAQTENLAKLPLRRIGAKIGLGDDNPRLVQHHIDQLAKKGFLWIDRKAGKMKLLTIREESNSDLMRIPIVGAADCGPASQVAEDQVEGYLPIAPGLLGLDLKKKYFAVRAIGSSMNSAKVQALGGQWASIEDGDLVIAESRNTPTGNKQSPYIVAVVDGLANIKKLVRAEGYARLESESTEKYMPIYLEPDLDNVMAGEVIGVVKG